MTSIWKHTTKGHGGILRQTPDTCSRCHAGMAFLVAAVMTAVSGWDYLKAGIETIRRLDAENTK